MLTIYLITCSVTRKSYVGITQMPLRRRWQAHVRAAQSPSTKGLSAAIRKHGHAAFSQQILKLAHTRQEAGQIEQEMIVRHRTLAPNGYNLTHGGDGGPTRIGQRHSAETKAKMRAAALGKPKSAIAVANMRRAITGRTLAPEHAAKIRQIGKGNRGKKHLNTQTTAHRIMLYERSLLSNCGVTFPAGPGSKKWRARVMINGRRKQIGNFDTREAAQSAFQKAVREILRQLRHQYEPPSGIGIVI